MVVVEWVVVWEEEEAHEKEQPKSINSNGSSAVTYFKKLSISDKIILI